MGVNGRKHPLGESWSTKPGGPNWSKAFGSGGKPPAAGCLAMIAIPVTALVLLLLVAANTTG